MNYYLSVDIKTSRGNKRIYDTSISIDEEIYQHIIHSNRLPQKYYDSVVETIMIKHKDVELSTMLFGIRKDDAQIIYLNV